MKHNHNISVVIPVYNEEYCIKQCLEALLLQKYVTEIIVIDNNCTDNTINIIKNYKNVVILKESQQGQQYAQYKGFNIAKNRLIARIDADTIVPYDWSEKVVEIFNNNSGYNAISGFGYSRTGITSKLIGKLWCYVYYLQAKSIFGTNVFWGSNMVFKKDAWQESKNSYYLGNKILHDDQSTSLAFAVNKYQINIMLNIVVSVDSGSIMRFKKLWNYYRRQFITKSVYNDIPNKIQSNYLVRIILFMLTLPIVFIWFVFSVFYSLYCILFPKKALINKR